MNQTLEEIAETIRRQSNLIAVDDFEISLQRSEGLHQDFEDGLEKNRKSDSNTWLSVRVVYHRQPGASAGFVSSPEDISNTVAAAVAQARGARPDPWFRFPLVKCRENTAPELAPLSSLESGLVTFGSVSERVSESVAQWNVTGFLQRRSERVALAYGTSFHFGKVSLQNHRGLPPYPEAVYEGPGQAASLEAQIARLLERTHSRRKARTLQYGGQPVLIRAPAMASLLGKFAPWFSAARVEDGSSPYADSVGKTVCNPSVFIKDESSSPHCWYGAPVDAEGAEKGDTLLVDGGVLLGFLHDSCTAARANQPSTGSFLRRPLETEAQICATNLSCAPGAYSVRDLEKAFPDCLAIDFISECRWDPAQRSLQLSALGWRLSRGEWLEPFIMRDVKCCPERLWHGVVAPSNDQYSCGSSSSPSILFKDLPLV